MANELQGELFYIEADLTTSPDTNDYGTDANYKLIACATSNGFSAAIAGIDVSNKCTGGYAASIAGQASFSFSFDGQMAKLVTADQSIKVTNDQLLAAMLAKKPIFIRSTDEAGSVYREGKVLITAYDETYPNADIATFTATFTGIGEPRIVKPTA